MKDDFESKIREVISYADPGVEVLSLTELTPDASLRSYYRLTLQNGWRPSVLAMVFHSTRCPEYESSPNQGKKIGADETFAQLSTYFRAGGLPVPEVFVDARADQIFIVEDFGDRLLADVLLGKETNPPPVRKEFLFQSVALLAELQSLPADPAVVCFSRRFSAGVYRSEVEEFNEFSLAGSAIGGDERAVIAGFFDELSRHLEQLPQRLAHRDYHGWNLVIRDHKICIIDFQDALMATRFYDIVALLNDRDMDQAIGKQLYRETLDEFVRLTGSGADANWQAEYACVLLQRDLKVAGRFAKLVQTRGLDRYGLWIPGTERRIGRNLAKLSRDTSAASGSPFVGSGETKTVLEIIARYRPSVAEGAAQESWY